MADFILHTTRHGATCSIHDLTRAQFDRFPGIEKEWYRDDGTKYWRKSFECGDDEVTCYTDEAPVKVEFPELDAAGLFNLMNVPDDPQTSDELQLPANWEICNCIKCTQRRVQRVMQLQKLPVEDNLPIPEDIPEQAVILEEVELPY